MIFAEKDEDSKKARRGEGGMAASDGVELVSDKRKLILFYSAILWFFVLLNGKVFVQA